MFVTFVGDGGTPSEVVRRSSPFAVVLSAWIAFPTASQEVI